jgi:hypothetical protein
MRGRTFVVSQGMPRVGSKTYKTNVSRREFQNNKAIDKKDFAAVETLLRMGQRKLELYSSPGVTDIH